MPRAFDQRQLIVDRNPLQQLEPNFGNLPTIDPEQLLRSMLEGFKLLTGIDSTGIPEFFAWVTDEIANILNIENWQEIFQSIIDFFAGLADRAGFLGVLEDVVAFFTGLADRAGFLGVLEDVVAFFTGLTDLSTWTGVLEDVVAFFAGLTDLSTWTGVLEDVVAFFAGLTDFSAWTAVLSEAVTFLSGLGSTALTALLAFVGWLWNGVAGGFAGFGATVDTVLKPLLTWLNWLWTQFGAASETFLKPLFQFLDWLWTQFGATVETVLKPIFTWLKTANLQSLNTGIVNTLWSLLNDGAEGVGKTIADVLNSIGDFVEGLVPAITGVPGALSIGQITSWAEDVLTKGLTWADFKTLFGEIPEDILGVLPIANVNLINPELMTQGGFDTATTLAPGTGWAWDGTNTHSGSGGSAKVTGNGTARALYSNQSVSVAAGDTVLISCWVKSTGTVGAGAITLSVVEFSGLVQGATTLIGSSGASAGWVQIGGGTYTVPAGVTTIRVKVAVTAGAATGSSVWFDDISVKKSGLLSGSWMQGVLGTMVDDLQAAIDQLVQGIKGAGVGSGTLVAGAATSIKAALQSIFTTLFGPSTSALPTSLVLNPLLATAIPGLSATKITEGDFPSERIRTRSIVTDKIGLDAVTTAEIGPLAVTSAELGTDAVTTAKIAADAVTTNEIAPLAVTSAELGNDSVTNAKIATNAVTANEIANSTITTTQFASTTIPAIGTALGTAITTGSGAKMSRTNTATKVTAGTGDNWFAAFFVNAAGSIQQDQRSADITVTLNGRYTVTHAGYYIVELGFTVNAARPAAGYFNVAPAIFLNGSSTPHKVGADSLGSFGNVFGADVGNYSRSAHSTFIVYLPAGGTVQAGYRNFGASNASFFEGDANGNTTFFSIAMLNRTAEG